MKVDTIRFGALDINEQSIVRMPKGPMGFEDETEFCLIHHRPDCNFRWLQSLHDPRLAFVVVEPMHFVSGYEFEISDTDVEKLHLASDDDALVLSVVTIANEGREVTMNLAAPIIVNCREMLGMQIVLQNESYSVRHTIAALEQTAEEATATKAA